MVLSNPLGVGAGNFQQAIGRYAPGYQNVDAHNTYLRCAAELGLLGITIYAIMIFYALLSLKRIMSRAREFPQTEQDQFTYIAYALAISLCTFLGCGMTITLLYGEAWWWLLILPVCLQRALENTERSKTPVPAPAINRPNGHRRKLLAVANDGKRPIH